MPGWMLKHTGGVLWMVLDGHFCSIDGAHEGLYSREDSLLGLEDTQSYGSDGVIRIANWDGGVLGNDGV